MNITDVDEEVLETTTPGFWVEQQINDEGESGSQWHLAILEAFGRRSIYYLSGRVQSKPQHNTSLCRFENLQLTLSLNDRGA